MKTLTVRLPEPLVADIDSESRTRGLSRSDIVRERLEGARREVTGTLADIADVVGSVDQLPADASARKKHYLRVRGYGRPRHR